MDMACDGNAIWGDDAEFHAVFIEPFASCAGAGMERAKERGDWRSRRGAGSCSRSSRTSGSSLRVCT